MSKLGSIVSTFKKDLETGASDVKNFLLKVAGEAPAVVQEVAQNETQIVKVIEAFLPSSKKFIDLGNTVLDAVAQAVEDAGAAASANGLSVAFDKIVVADIQALIAAAKSASPSSGKVVSTSSTIQPVKA